jgi:hypothetical protein
MDQALLVGKEICFKPPSRTKRQWVGAQVNNIDAIIKTPQDTPRTQYCLVTSAPRGHVAVSMNGDLGSIILTRDSTWQQLRREAFQILHWQLLFLRYLHVLRRLLIGLKEALRFVPAGPVEKSATRVENYATETFHFFYTGWFVVTIPNVV